MQHKRIALLELLQKHIRRRDMTELLDSIVKLLSYNYYTDNQVITMFNYLIQKGIEFAFLDILLSFEQPKPPHKTRKTSGLISDEEAKKLIMAEHRNLELSHPDFGQ
ncbi:Rpn family recombination-promoting nuclease/putative transposase [Arsenophonus nasoniae]|uniref:Rpn family recombination-promoting nuclease/putative transposase n=1 Tax=Arsenophonus nasoniae TaxID=638 RepID=UPI003878FB02